MASPEIHAKCGASNAHRYLVCTASPTFEAQFPASTSVYAEEGTLAHSICELFVKTRGDVDRQTHISPPPRCKDYPVDVPGGRDADPRRGVLPLLRAGI